MHTEFWWGDPRERDYWKDLDLDGRIRLKLNFKKWKGVGMDWLDLAEDLERWRALVNAAMNFRVP